VNELGGWPTVIGIYAFFSSLAITGWIMGAPRPNGVTSMRPLGQAAMWLIAAMLVGTYLRQVPRPRLCAVPATAEAAAATVNVVAQRLRQACPHEDTVARLGPRA